MKAVRSYFTVRLGLIAAAVMLLAGVATFAAPERAAAQTRMTLTLNEWDIISELPEVPAGEITFDVVNTGEDVHEVIFLRSDLDITTLPPSRVRGEVDEDAVGEYFGGFEDVAPTTMVSGVITLQPGRYILLCNLTNHYAKGMVSTLQVTE